MKTVNQKIACIPLSRDFKPKLKVEGGFGAMEQRTELVELKVLLDSESDYKQGDLIYVKGSSFDRSDWGKSVLTLNDFKLILVPEMEVIIIKQGEKNDPVPTSEQKHT